MVIDLSIIKHFKRSIRDKDYIIMAVTKCLVTLAKCPKDKWYLRQNYNVNKLNSIS